jgi:hypothetical protein
MPISETPNAALALGPGPHLFVDRTLIEASSHLTRRVCSPRRDLMEPVITAREDGCFQPYVSVLRDPTTQQFRAWYGVPAVDEAGNPSPICSHLAHMESEDGIRWRRPHQVLADPAPIQFGAEVLDDGPNCPAPQQRYKYAWWKDGGMRVAGSPDGLTWMPLTPGIVLPHNHDINSLFHDRARNRYLALVSHVTRGEAWSGERRTTLASFSPDLIHWETPWPVITPNDAFDAGETQFYCMAGVLARGDLLIGLLKVLRDDLPADPDGPVEGIGYTVLAWSRDGGRTWTRDREPFLDRHPEPGAWDHAMTWANCQLPVGDEVYCYYGGYARGHKTARFTERQIGLVRFPCDRYVAWEAGNIPGTLRTPLLKLDARLLTLNLDARSGEARVQVLDAEGTPVPGFAYSDCHPPMEDALAAEVRWAQPLKRLRGKPVRLEITLRSGSLYALYLHP